MCSQLLNFQNIFGQTFQTFYWMNERLGLTPGLSFLSMRTKINSSLETHWGRVTHLCVSKLTIIGSDNGLSPGRHQAIIWTNAGILLIGTLGKNFSEILIEIPTFPLNKILLKMASAKCCPIRHGLNVLITRYSVPRETCLCVLSWYILSNKRNCAW